MNTRFSMLLLFLPGFCISGFAQQNHTGLIRGQLTDSASKQILSDASVTVKKTTDSSTAGFTITDRTGNFQVQDLPAGTYRIIISFQGYESIVKR
ncbi:MAG TPA: carboxypeptidase regulatory-like domain-containing protein, partial [Puia sp.]|nr:carboxypeptidase regulatory-like domain-containing protein [Puia sp.]